MSPATICRQTAAQLSGLKRLRVERQRPAAAKRCRRAGAHVRAWWRLSNAAQSVPSDSEPWPWRHLIFGGDCRLSGEGEHLNRRACWLTFELSGPEPAWCLGREADDKQHGRAAQVPCRWRSASSEGLGVAFTFCERAYEPKTSQSRSPSPSGPVSEWASARTLAHARESCEPSGSIP
jgi:hypothetical protein